MKLKIIAATVAALCVGSGTAIAQVLKGPIDDKPLKENWAPTKWGVNDRAGSSNHTKSSANIRRALTYVPATARSFWEMANVLYMTGAQMRDFGTEYRAISHAQIEMIAGRVSALNQCVY